MSLFRRAPKSDPLTSALVTLRDRTQVLYNAVEPEPTRLGLIGAGTIGVKAENTRQGIDSLTNALIGTAKENGGHLTQQQAQQVYEFFRDELVELIENTLKRISTVHYERFCELGMGIARVVKITLGWMLTSVTACTEATTSTVSDPDLKVKAQEIGTRIKGACERALDVYSGVKT